MNPTNISSVTNKLLCLGGEFSWNTLNYRVKIYMEHGVYHVRMVYDNRATTKEGPGQFIRLTWGAFCTLKEAKRFFSECARCAKYHSPRSPTTHVAAWGYTIPGTFQRKAA